MLWSSDFVVDMMSVLAAVTDSELVYGNWFFTVFHCICNDVQCR